MIFYRSKEAISTWEVSSTLVQAKYTRCPSLAITGMPLLREGSIDVTSCLAKSSPFFELGRTVKFQAFKRVGKENQVQACWCFMCLLGNN